MRILFLSDFHGHLPDLSGWSADLLVAGGDYCEVDEIRRLKFAALQRGMKATRWAELVGAAKAEELVERALAEGAAVVAGLAESGWPVLAIPGNSDRTGLYAPDLVDRHLPRPDDPAVEGRVVNIEARLVVRGGVAFAGLGGWSGPAAEESQAWEVDALREQWDALCAARARAGAPPPPLVLVSHNVPHGSRLDGVNNPELPAFAQGMMVGSTRCLAALEALHPALCLSGHLHENYGRVERIGSTLCLCAAGAYRGEGVLVEIDPDGGLSEPQFVRAANGATRLLS